MIHEDDCEEPQDYAAKVLCDYGLTDSDARDAAWDSIRAAAKAQLGEYQRQADVDELNVTERSILLIRIDTLQKFADITPED